MIGALNQSQDGGLKHLTLTLDYCKAKLDKMHVNHSMYGIKKYHHVEYNPLNEYYEEVKSKVVLLAQDSGV